MAGSRSHESLGCKCGGSVKQIESNGVLDDDRIRWEVHECVVCGDEGTIVFVPDGKPIIEGCLSNGSD